MNQDHILNFSNYDIRRFPIFEHFSATVCALMSALLVAIVVAVIIIIIIIFTVVTRHYGDMTVSTYIHLYPDTSCSSRILVSGLHVSGVNAALEAVWGWAGEWAVLQHFDGNSRRNVQQLRYYVNS